MAFDGFVVASLRAALADALTGGRITKISQPEPDELLLTIKTSEQHRLRISANASLPLVLLTNDTKPAPLTAPAFCMLLRKHLSGARITGVFQPDTERILLFGLEHFDELMDLQEKWLIVELMGKHSNIIFCDSDFLILDSIKRVSSLMSSVREVLPGRRYFIPKTADKCSPLLRTAALSAVTDSHPEVFGPAPSPETIRDFYEKALKKPMPLFKALYTTFNGLSPLLSTSLVTRAGADCDRPGTALNAEEKEQLFSCIRGLETLVLSGSYSPRLYCKQGVPEEFHVFPVSSYENSKEYELRLCGSVSEMLSDYYLLKDRASRIRQRSTDLKKTVGNAVARTVKKLELQQKQLESTEDREKLRIYGELLTTYGYSCPPGSTSFTCLNFYTDEDITIPLDPTLSALENAKHYFDRFSKLKRTASQLAVHMEETEAELTYLRSVLESLELSETEADLSAIRAELTDSGYLRFKRTEGGKKAAKLPKNRPCHFVTPDGFHLYVGRNNYQNDELTFHFAEGNDWWFHVKNAPGSHVILKTGGKEPGDRDFEYAAALAAFYSSERNTPKAEVDYVLKKQVKKPAGAKPGFVVYYTNYSMMITPSVSGLTEEE